MRTQSYCPRFSSGVHFMFRSYWRPLPDHGEVRIVVADLRSFFLQQFDDGEGGRFAQVVDVFLVGDAEDQDLRAR